MLIRAVKALALALLAAIPAVILVSAVVWANASISTLQSATVPLPANSCIPVSQGPGTDAVMCHNYAAYFGLSTTNLAISDSQPADPTGVSGGTPLMQGLAASITPAITGTVVMTVTGTMSNSSSAAGATARIYYGTGSAPANGAALTGAACGTSISGQVSGAAGLIPYTTNCLVTGLTIGVPIWVDIALNEITGGTATITKNEVVLVEQ